MRLPTTMLLLSSMLSVGRSWTTRSRTTTARILSSRSGLRRLATANSDNNEPYQITTPIYYVNDKPHIGHAYTSTGTLVISVVSCSPWCTARMFSHPPTACDVLARYMRLSGRDVFFLSGTDEHGQKVEQSAANKGVDPRAFVDDVSRNFRDLLELLHISNDQFIRTTEQSHKEAVQVS